MMSSSVNLKRLDDLLELSRDVRERAVYIEHILGLFCYKYLSEPLQENTIVWRSENRAHYGSFKSEFITENGYFIEPEYLFSALTKLKPDEKLFIILDAAFEKFNKEAISYKYQELFDLDFTKLGQTPEQMSEIINIINSIGNGVNTEVSSEVFDYLLSQTSEGRRTSNRVLHTPKTVCELLARVVGDQYQDGLKIYDPAYKSGALLLSVAKQLNGATIYGQEESKLNQNIAKMWAITNDVKDFTLKLGNSIEYDSFLHKQFDIVVAHPSFSMRWSGINRGQFGDFSTLAPQSKADYAYIQIMLSHLKETGTMAAFFPMGILFRGANEKEIREELIESKNCIDTVIQLPANLFIETSIPVCLVIFKKNRNREDILFVNASNEYVKTRHNNILSSKNIKKITDIYTSRGNLDRFSRLVSLDEIAKNDYNLGVNRYIDTFEIEEAVDLEKLNHEIAKTEKEIADLEKVILDYHEKIDRLTL